jgi:hypothetical protein
MTPVESYHLGKADKLKLLIVKDGYQMRLNPWTMEGEEMMRRNVLYSLVGSGIVCLALTGVSQATVPRAFVSISGSDTNPCSAVQPCRSFNQALTVVEAGGEIVVQDSGGYSTGFTITKSVTIDAAGFNASVISTGLPDLCTINTGPNDRVALRGISFHGGNFGANAMVVSQVGSLYVEHCSIEGFANFGVVMTKGGNIWVTDTDIRNCASTGLGIASSASAAHLVAQDSRFTECDIGVDLVAAGAAVTGWLSNCTASLCGDGFIVESASTNNADLTLTNCRAFGNARGPNAGNGLLALTGNTGSATMRIANCVVTQNSIGIFVSSSGGGVASVIGTSPGTNYISGNGTNGSTTSSVTLH